MDKMWLEPPRYTNDVSTPLAHDISTCTPWLSAGHRITFSSLSPSSSELVKVSSSVPVASFSY